MRVQSTIFRAVHTGVTQKVYLGFQPANIPFQLVEKRFWRTKQQCVCLHQVSIWIRKWKPWFTLLSNRVKQTPQQYNIVCQRCCSDFYATIYKVVNPGRYGGTRPPVFGMRETNFKLSLLKFAMHAWLYHFNLYIWMYIINIDQLKVLYSKR